MCHWVFGTADFHEMRMELRVNGVPLRVGARPLAVLVMLLRAGGRLVTKAELAALWGDQHQSSVSNAALEKAVSRLRLVLPEGLRGHIRAECQGWRFDFTRQPQVVTRRVTAFAAPEALQPGQTLPHRSDLVLEKLLGHGTQTWLARGPRDAELRVLKLATDATGRAALRLAQTQQLQLQERLADQPGLVRLLGGNLDQAPFYLEYEYAGQNLAEWAADGGLRSMGLAGRLRLFVDIAAVVAAAHNIGVLHTALTPSNLLLAPGPHGLQVKLGDFGSSRLLDASYLQRGSGPGSACPPPPCDAAYLAPEVYACQAMTSRSDVYALGVLLAQLVSGDFHSKPAAGWGEGADSCLRALIAAATHQDSGRRLSAEMLIAGLQERFPAATPGAAAPARLSLVAAAGGQPPPSPAGSPEALRSGRRQNGPRLVLVKPAG